MMVLKGGENIHPEFVENELNILLKSEVKRLTSHLVSYEKPKVILLVPRFTIEDESYTGTMKMRRHMVNKMENEKINNFLEKVEENKKEIKINI